MAEDITKRSRRDGTERKQFITAFKDNRIVVQTQLSRNIYRIYRRNFDTVSRSVFLLRFYSRISGISLKDENELTNQIMVYIETVKASLEKKLSVSQQMLSKHAVTTTEPLLQPIDVTIIDPLANYYLKLLTCAHQLETAVSSLWLATLLNDEQRRHSLNEIENELTQLKTNIRALSIGVRERFLERKQRLRDKGDTALIDNSEQILNKTVVEANEAISAVSKKAAATTAAAEVAAA